MFDLNRGYEKAIGSHTFNDLQFLHVNGEKSEICTTGILHECMHHDRLDSKVYNDWGVSSFRNAASPKSC